MLSYINKVNKGPTTICVPVIVLATAGCLLYNIVVIKKWVLFVKDVLLLFHTHWILKDFHMEKQFGALCLSKSGSHTNFKVPVVQMHFLVGYQTKSPCALPHGSFSLQHSQLFRGRTGRKESIFRACNICPSTYPFKQFIIKQVYSRCILH